MLTTFEKGFAKGFEEGMQMEKRRIIRVCLEHRFGPLSDAALQAIESWPPECLDALCVTILDVTSLADLGMQG